MCTCLDFKTKDFYFGRTLDLEYHYNEVVCITPRNYHFSLKNGKEFNTKYALIGMSFVFNDYPLYYEACNEKGLCMAGLNFPKSALYNEEKENKLNLTPFELIPYFLGKYSSVDSLLEEIKKLNITNIKFNDSLPLSDLHWMISDKDKSIVIEQTIEGLKIFDNKVGVMTNNPPFNYQLMNLNNYQNISPLYAKNCFSSNLDLSSYGVGMGSIGLPGDYSPMSRFVKTTFMKFNSICDNDEKSSVSQFFHILDSVSMVKGSVITKDNKCDISYYTSCINATKGIYYYKTYNNSRINAIYLNEENKNKSNLTIFNLNDEQDINIINK